MCLPSTRLRDKLSRTNDVIKNHCWRCQHHRARTDTTKEYSYEMNMQYGTQSYGRQSDTWSQNDYFSAINTPAESWKRNRSSSMSSTNSWSPYSDLEYIRRFQRNNPQLQTSIQSRPLPPIPTKL